MDTPGGNEVTAEIGLLSGVPGVGVQLPGLPFWWELTGRANSPEASSVSYLMPPVPRAQLGHSQTMTGF